MIGKIRYAGYLLIVMQGLGIALLAIFLLNQRYMNVWRTYPQNNESVTVHLKNVPTEKQRDTQNFLLTSAEEQALFIARMDLLLNKSGGMDGYKFGVYVILGLENAEARSSFLQGLADAGGLQTEDLLEADSGNAANNRVMRDVLLAFLAAQIFLNVVFFLVVVMKNLSKQGKLALLGWSRTAFAKEVLGGFFLFSVAVIPVLMLGNSLIAGWERFSFVLLGYWLMASFINVLVVLLELLISAFVIVMIKPLDAIRGRIPKRTLYALGIFAYLIISGSLIFCGAYVDQPMTVISDNARLAKRWETVSEYQILSDISIGQDAASFSGGSCCSGTNYVEARKTDFGR